MYIIDTILYINNNTWYYIIYIGQSIITYKYALTPNLKYNTKKLNSVGTNLILKMS